MITAVIIVKGMVQGVGFRYFCRKKAIELGISGYAKNLYNGDVEIEAEGERNIIMDYVKELKIGPVYAKVNAVIVTESEYKGIHKGFSII